MAEKRYYWLKLKEDYFNQLEIKRLRKYEDGNKYTVILLELQLYSLKNDGHLIFSGIEDTFAEELAIAIDEDIKDVQFVIDYLEKVKWLSVTEKEGDYELSKTVECIGSESASAKRVRRYREKNSVESGNDNCNDSTLQCNTEIDTDKNKETDSEQEKHQEKTDTVEMFGKYHNVFLSCDEVQRLSVIAEEKGGKDVYYYIDKLSQWEHDNTRYALHAFDVVKNLIEKET